VTVSVLIPHWNRRDLLERVLAGLRAQTLPPFEILVIDNGSTDGSQEAARALGAEVLQLPANLGFAAAVNRGLEVARGDLVALLNNDVELAPDWIETLGCAMQQEGAWFAIGKLLDYHRRDHVDGVGDALTRGGGACRLGHSRPDGLWFNRPRRIFFPSATAVLLRREFFARVGSLEVAFFSYLEDVDLGLRAALLGLEGLYVPQAVGYHHGSATLGAWNPRMIEWVTRNQILLVAKYYPLAWWWRVLVGQILWAALAFRRGRALPWLRGLAAGLTRARTLRRCAVSWRTDGTRLATVLVQSEQELVSFEQSTGWDHYWRWYFRLAPVGRRTQP
jgi:GT2 family glycosyltransferase